MVGAGRCSQRDFSSKKLSEVSCPRATSMARQGKTSASSMEARRCSGMGREGLGCRVETVDGVNWKLAVI